MNDREEEQKETSKSEYTTISNIYNKRKEEKKMKLNFFYLSPGVPSLFSIGIVLKQPVGND